MLQNKRAPVLIVGAGPTGLVAAIELTRHGIPVRIVDKALPRPAVESRAVGTHSRTMEIFEQIGVLPAMFDAGKTIDGFAFHADGGEIGEISFAGIDAPYPFVMILPQAETERILIEKLAALGVKVERPVELIAVEQTYETVTARLRAARGAEENAEFSYLIAADGGRSRIRTLLDLSFEGTKTEAAYVADSAIDWDKPPDANRAHSFLGTNRMLIFGLLPTGAWRIGATMPADDKFMRDAKPDRELLQALIDEHGGINARLREVTWSSAFNISYRKIEKLRHNRIFFAGDAAHIHSPAGGQGMNTGIQDAYNLAWKLALTIKGAGGEKLLDSYHTERYPIIEKLLPMIEQSEEMLTVNHPLAAQLRNFLLATVTDFGFVQSLGSRTLGGFLVNYRRSSIVGERTLSPFEHLRRLGDGLWHPNPLDDVDFARAPQPGDRAPDANGLSYGKQNELRLFKLFAGDVKHKLLVFSGEQKPNDIRRGEIKQMIERVEQKYDELIAPYVIEIGDHAAQDSATTIRDVNGNLHRRYGARFEGAYLIRPDGYIGFRSQPADFSALDDYLKIVLGAAHQRG